VQLGGWWGTLAVLMISGLLALGYSRVRALRLRWSLLIVSPFAVAWMVYWAGVWHLGGFQHLQLYRVWDVIFAVTWGLPGLACSILVGVSARFAVGRRGART
jgi:hypothetical protein